MTEVRRHARKTAAGKTVRVRQHHRRGGDSEDERQVPERPAGAAYVGDMRPAAAPPDDVWDDGEPAPDEDWWADDSEDEERYEARMRQVENAPDVTALLQDEALARDTALADAAALRLITERQDDDPMVASGERNVAADRKVREAKEEVRRTRGFNPLLPPSDAEKSARGDLRAAWREQDAAQAERQRIFEQQMRAEAERRGVPAYESQAARLWRKFRKGRDRG